MKALEVLEFDGVRGILARYITSPLGRGELARLGPTMDRAALEGRFAEIGEARRYLEDAIANERGAVRLRFSDLPDVAAPLAKARIEGAVLEPLEIHALTGLLERASEARHVLSAASAHFPLLALRSTAIGEFRGLLADLRGKILPDGTVADDASVALARLRRDKARQQKSIQDSLERFLRAHREDGLLQEQFVTIKNDRFVVPVVTGQQKKVTGVVHGASSSGQTVFLEPLETIELNNDLVRLNEEELREVHRILRELSAKLRAAQEDIARAVGTLAGLEVLFGIADFARAFDCVVPRFSPPEARRLQLKAARHPLLEDVLKRQQKRVVPITLALDEGQRSLLISGPNTGGKTVAMKTVGLLALMAQSGLPVPAEEAEFPLFEHVLADVGDQQSIAESLSSFSSHILHVREMLTEVTRDSLVLLDELGRATDPEEGGALGVALLDWFRSTGAFTLASTHLLALKIYGANTGGVLNASMGFNDATLEPTFVLRTGAPGKSAGIEIAERLGLPEKLIGAAKSNLTGAERDIARFLAELHAKLDATAALEGELQAREARLRAREESLKVEWDKKESAKIRELERK
ncbi:MAG: endonuclease MutS2, partial [Bryobacter sp.]|nr:endonuclease MutS2 [Bryobacter sp.]